MRFPRFLLAVAGMAAALVQAYPAHYFVVHEAADQTLSISSHQLVELSGSPQQADPAAPANRLERRLRALVVDKADGQVSFDTFSVASPWLRGEFHGAGQIDGHIIAQAEHDYVVRIPAIGGAVLRLQVQAGSAPAADALAPPSLPPLEVDLDAYSGKSAKALPAGWATGSLVNSGDPSNRLDMLVVAEGYTAAQQSQFISDATSFASQFFSIAPYADFSHLINVTWLFVPSNQSGADKPSCPETPGSTVVSVDTAFDGTFCTAGIRRLVTVNNTKVLNAAAAVPNWDEIMVIVNDTEYGGSGGSMSVATVNSSSTQIAQHEFGHTFMLLADEYETAYPGYPACSDITGSGLSACEPNVSDQTSRSLLKWRGWVDAATPIPSSGPLADPIAAGLWLGARYRSSGMYRQCYDGIMRALGQPFCHIEREAFVNRLYNGGWGQPSGGVSLIEPGSTPASSSVSAPAASDVVFQAVAAGSHAPLSAQWSVDGAQVLVQAPATGQTTQFTYHVPDTSSHTVTLKITDSTPMLLTPATRSRTWTVQGTAITKVPATVSLSSSSNPAAAGATVTFTASISGASATATGTVTFAEGATTLCASVPLAGGVAMCATSALGAGSHAITASYSGDVQYNPGTSGTLTQSIIAASGTAAVSLSSSIQPAAVGQPVTFTALVSGSSSQPGGSVTFSDGSAVITGCSGVALTSGWATCTVSSLGAGTHSITAQYSGDAVYPAASSASLTQTIDSPVTTADLAISQLANVSTASTGKDVVFTLTASNRGPASATGVTVTDTLPAGWSYVWATPGCTRTGSTVACTASTLGSGASAVFTVVGRPTGSGSATNTAYIAADVADASSSNNSAAITLPVNASPAGAPIVRYRLYNPISQEHLYTTDANENAVLGAGGVWIQEGTAGSVLNNPGSFNGVTATPYYRLYNTFTLWHHWTTDPNEYYTLVTYPGWNGEGVDGYLLPAATTGATALYRLVYPDGRGLHHWTIDANEYTTLVNTYGWVGEGGTGFVVQ